MHVHLSYLYIISEMEAWNAAQIISRLATRVTVNVR
jgi:hypothetical protein